MTPLESADIEIESLALGGDGVGRLPDGRTVFVPFSAPGDTVRVRLTISKPRFARGEVLDILEPSDGREDPPCRYYRQCAGCQYQHITYEAELQAKEQQVRDAILRIGKLDPGAVRPIIASPERYGYRNRITLHLQDGVTGFYGIDNRRIIPIHQCLIAHEQINRQLSSTSKTRSGGPDRRVTLKTDGTTAGFSQANLFLQEKLRAAVLDLAPKQGLTFIEGYAGNGWFTTILADRFEHTISIEKDPRLVARAQQALSSHTKIECLTGDCENWLPELLAQHGKGIDFLLLDPPRDGLSVRIREVVTLSTARALTYVSCNPATLARDLRELSARWKVLSIQPLDMFPATAHIECVAYLEPA